MPCLAICGACDTHGKARLQLSELQQDDGQVVDEEQGIHQGHGVLDDPLVVLILTRMMFILHFKEPQDNSDVYATKGMNATTPPPQMQKSASIYTRYDSSGVLFTLFWLTCVSRILTP